MLGNVVVYLFLAIIVGVAAAWLLSGRSERRTTRAEEAKEAADEARLIPPT